MRSGQSALWPSYREKEQKYFNLALFCKYSFQFEDGTILRIETFDELLDILFERNLLTYVPSLTDDELFPFLFYAVSSKDCEVLCSSQSKPLAIKVKRKSRTRWIVPSSTWDAPFDEGLLTDLRELFTYFGITKPTPGSLGQAIARQTFRYLPSHTAPSILCQEYLRAHCVGGRCDTLCEVGAFYPKLLALDEAGAYLLAAMYQPTGTAILFKNGNVQDFATYFAECEITIKRELVLGPFPLKTGRKDGKIVYPTLPGTYKAYLWKEQVHDCIEAGCTVKVLSGYGWRYITGDLSAYCRYMHFSRMALNGRPTERYTKKVAVSGLGHFGMSNTFYRLVADGIENEPCIPDDDGLPLMLFTRAYNDYKRACMVHWFDYTVMMAGRKLYEYGLPYAKDARLIMTNYDELLIIEKDERSRYAQKHSLEALMCEAGDLRWQELTNVTILGDRSLKCDQKTIRPGVPRELQEVEN